MLRFSDQQTESSEGSLIYHAIAQGVARLFSVDRDGAQGAGIDARDLEGDPDTWALCRILMTQSRRHEEMGVHLGVDTGTREMYVAYPLLQERLL